MSDGGHGNWRRQGVRRAETVDGPSRKPSDFNWKPPKGHWCSGCGSHEHFEFDCNYYNRTRPPTNRYDSYEDVYKRHRPMEQTVNFSAQSQRETGSNMHPTPISPRIHGYQPNQYGQPQRFGQNFGQSYGTNSNFHQVPVVQSVPNSFGLQQSMNMGSTFYPNPNLSTNRNTVLSNTAPITSRTSENVDEACFKKNPVEEENSESESEPETEISSPSPHGVNNKRDFLKLKDFDELYKLQSQEGKNFLKQFTTDPNNFIIQIVDRKKKNKKFNYWCMVKGSPDILPEVMASIRKYIKSNVAGQFEEEPFDIMEAFNGRDFNMQVLQESLSKLNNSHTNWVRETNHLFKKMCKTKKKLFNSKDGNKGELKNQLSSQYIALNAILLGKLDVAEGPKHMKILQQAVSEGPTGTNEEILRQSYDYVFKNDTRLNIKYNSAITELPCHDSLKTGIDDLFKSGISICEKNNMKSWLSKLKFLYNSVIYCKYSSRKVEMFRKLYDSIKHESEK